MVKSTAKHSDSVESTRRLLVQIAKALVDDEQSVEVESEVEEGATCFRIRVGRSDVGKLIGKQGRTARSIRTVLGAASMKEGHRFTLDILQEKSTNLE